MANYVSLFDFLGQPAGPELGKAVAEAAKNSGIKTNTRFVSTKKYTGLVMLYPNTFLIDYFNSTSLERKVSESQNNTLPF